MLSLISPRQARLLYRPFEGFRWLDREWLDLLGVQLVAVRRRCGRFRGRGLETLQQEETMCLLRNPSWPARFDLLDEAHPVADEGAELDRVNTLPGAAPPVVTGDASGWPSWWSGGSGGHVETLSYRPGAFRLRTTTEQERLLLVREARSEGWKAQVDGNPTRIFPAAGLFFAVPIPAGVHIVEVEYEARGLRAGLGLAAAWVVVAVGLWWRDRHRRP